PTLITPLGISWLASQIGHPINKYVRDGLDVKICVVKDVSEPPLSSIEVMIEENVSKVVEVEYPEPRSYKKQSVWSRKGKEVISQPKVVVSSSGTSGNALKTSTGGKGYLKTTVRDRLEGMDQKPLCR
ncbi:hypothetical protein LINPERPRIM_LOCUS21302, partial [Linum perenne]